MPAVFDREHFDNMTGGERALQREVVDLFSAQAAGWEAALAPGRDWRALVHTMKGSARGIGLMALAQACEAAEGGAQSGLELARVRAALSEALQALRMFSQD